MRTFNRGQEFISNPSWSREKLTKNNNDMTAHWTSKLNDRRWQIDAFAGMHREYFNDRSPNARSTTRISWSTGAPTCGIWSRRRAAADPRPDGGIFQPCPVDDYRTGGFGLVKKYTGFRWTGEVKSTHLFEAGGHHELKYGWRLELHDVRSGPLLLGTLGSRALVQQYPGQGGVQHRSFFTLDPNEYPSSFGGVGSGSRSRTPTCSTR